MSDPWSSHDVPRIVSECTMLDINHARTASHETSSANIRNFSEMVTTKDSKVASAEILEIKSSSHHQVLLQDMIALSVALKSEVGLDIIDSAPTWLPRFLMNSASSPTAVSPPVSSAEDVSDHRNLPRGDSELRMHTAEMLSGLQREVLLLRNELNLELWLKRQNVRHIGRLYEDRLVSKSAELERQGLVSRIFTACICLSGFVCFSA